MDLDNAIFGRRSIRKYNDIKVEQEVILKIIEAGTWAPSACNIQGWKFIVIDDKKELEKITNLGGASFVSKVKQAILVLYNNQTDNLEYQDYVQSAAACIQNMLLKAYSLGVGTCWVNNLPNKSKLRKLLNIPGYYSPIALITLGYYDQKINDRKRKYAIEDLVSYNEFQFLQEEQGKNRLVLTARRIARKIYKRMPFKKQILKLVGGMEKKFDN